MSVSAISRQKLHTEEVVEIHLVGQIVSCQGCRERVFGPATLERIAEEIQG